MKNRYLILPLVAVALLASLPGCKKAARYQDLLYITGTESDVECRFTIEGPASMGVSVTSSSLVATDQTVTLELRPDLVAEYNRMTGKLYKPLPADSYSLRDADVVVAVGKNSSRPALFDIGSTDNFEEGQTYCMPVRIAKVSGGMDVLESSRTMYVVVNRKIVTRAVQLGSYAGYYRVPKFGGDATVSALPQVTMEARIKASAFQGGNPFISSVMGLEENFLLRFGDVNIKNNQLQLAGGGYPVTTKTLFETGKWYHVAVVYDGAKIGIYVDGVQDSSVDAPRGTIDLSVEGDRAFFIGMSCGNRLFNGAISECRVWKRALTAAELKNNVCYVDPASNGLLAYWRFNAIQNNTVEDLTGHGYDATTMASLPLVEGVRCPE